MQAVLGMNHSLEAFLDLLVFLVVLGVRWVNWWLRHRLPDLQGGSSDIARILARILLEMFKQKLILAESSHQA